MSATLIRTKGLADIATAVILVFRPNFIYDSLVTRQIHAWTGLHLSDPAIAPGFNHSLACMVAAVGIGHVVAARGVDQPIVHSILFAMNTTWAILASLTCTAALFSAGQGKGLEELGSATLMMTALNHLMFSAALWWMGKEARSSKLNIRLTTEKKKDR